MPWDHTELWTADISEDGTLGEATQVAGQPGRVDLSAGVVAGRPAVLRLRPHRMVESIPPGAGARRGDGAHQGRVRRSGLGVWARIPTLSSLRTASCASTSKTASGMWPRWTPARLSLKPIETPYTEMSRGDIKASPGRVVLEAASASLPYALLTLDPDTGRTTTLRESRSVPVGEGYISTPRPIEFETTGGSTAHALYYKARNPDFEPRTGKSPLFWSSATAGRRAAPRQR